MEHIKERIALLEVKLAELASSQQEVSAQIHALQLEIIGLKKREIAPNAMQRHQTCII
jgi:chaperonin cofactor prefoldin